MGIQFGDEESELSEMSRDVLMDLNGEYCAWSSCGTLRSGRWKYLRGSNMVTNMEWGDGDQWQRKELKDRVCAESALAVMECDVNGYLSVSEDSLECQHSEMGCLFDITVDACEYHNVATEYPEVVQEMIGKLDVWSERAVDALVRDDNTIGFREYDPLTVCDSQFWCPFQQYANVEFEEVLREQYLEKYAVKVGEDGEERRFAMSFQMHAVDEAATIDSIFFAVLSLVLGVSLCFVVYVNVKHRRGVRSQCLEAIELRNETAPLSAHR